MGITKIVIDIAGAIGIAYTAVSSIMFPAQAWQTFSQMAMYANTFFVWATARIISLIAAAKAAW